MRREYVMKRWRFQYIEHRYRPMNHLTEVEHDRCNLDWCASTMTTTKTIPSTMVLSILMIAVERLMVDSSLDVLVDSTYDSKRSYTKRIANSNRTKANEVMAKENYVDDVVFEDDDDGHGHYRDHLQDDDDFDDDRHHRNRLVAANRTFRSL